ncbi:HAD-IA family hydrolase [Gordonia jinhuaensis]|uniref:Hydrolase n=1 Tax=Gordonia jinhuaensis TaxID=1517702 RepID=A0A916STZ7_9ACTN|nr:HAD-IA family hydrolase [Gordonia jinhuaensis]GGB17585.1 hydrolase [Gordonia jinhuaensis]
MSRHERPDAGRAVEQNVEAAVADAAAREQGGPEPVDTAPDRIDPPGAGPFEAVLFDFSGTLFRFTERDEWFEGVTDDAGEPLHITAQAEIIRRMTAPTGEPVAFTDEERQAWEQRDLDPAQHRRAYLAVLRGSGITDPHAEKLYELIRTPSAWQPYPDTAQVLRELAARGIKVGVVSNIAFDLREVFALYGLDDLVASWSLSYEVGATKPRARIFRHALDALDVATDATLMVGDSAEADGGAMALGCAFGEVEPLPIEQRPDGLVRILTAAAIL